MAYIDIDDKAAETIIGALAAKVDVLQFQLDNAMAREDEAHKKAEDLQERMDRYLDALKQIKLETCRKNPYVPLIREYLADAGVL